MEPYRRQDPKIGRNDLCPCGSGLKFKRCHYNPRFELPFLVQQAKIEKGIEEKVRRLLEERKAQEFQRQQQQGLGRPIISVEHQGYRFVAVSQPFALLQNLEDFHRFFRRLHKNHAWRRLGKCRTQETLQIRHPILQWYHHICRLQQKYVQKPGEIYSAPATGAVSAYYGLAYNLYLIAHNVHDIESRLVKRLKNVTVFKGRCTKHVWPLN